MTSTITNASANANTRSRRKRTRVTVDEENPTAIKRPKKEAKLDKLKAQLKEIAGVLKNRLIQLQEHLVNEKVAKESAETVYMALVDQCDDILMGIEPDQDDLELLKEPFVNNFQPEEVLRNRLSGGMLPFRRAQSASLMSTPQFQ
jgi:division protein CdvB (Snf7/Vps24/ESCRT-III family)